MQGSEVDSKRLARETCEAQQKYFNNSACFDDVLPDEDEKSMKGRPILEKSENSIRKNMVYSQILLIDARKEVTAQMIDCLRYGSHNCNFQSTNPVNSFTLQRSTAKRRCNLECAHEIRV